MDAHVSVEALEKFKQILTQFSKNMSVEAQKMQLHLKKTHAQLEQKHFQLKKQLQMCQDPISYERAHQQLMEFERLFAGFCHAAQECIKSFQQQELMATNREKTVVTIDRKVGVLKEYLGPRTTSSGIGQVKGEEEGVTSKNHTHFLVDNIINNPKLLHGKSPQEISEAFNEAGYKTTIKKSTKGSKKATKVLIEGHKINYIQIHPGGGRHVVPYIKVKGNGVNYKVIDGPKSQYKGNPNEEKGKFYWMEDN